MSCSITDCLRAVVARGWCATHYHHWRRHGDPLAGRFYGNCVTYEGAHRRVRADRGRASEHVCPCGSPAAEWAYDNEDPAEKVSEKGYAYSLKPDRYIAMCLPCHKAHDTAHRIAAAAAYRQIRFGGTP